MIYLITNEDATECKIGYSKNLEGAMKRLKTLQTGNPSKLTLDRVIEGTTQDEKQLHLQFKNYKLIGEWFKFDEEGPIYEHFMLKLEWYEQMRTAEEFYYMQKEIRKSNV